MYQIHRDFNFKYEHLSIKFKYAKARTSKSALVPNAIDYDTGIVYELKYWMESVHKARFG